MNLLLKVKIIEKFGTQGDFAQVVKEGESLISRVVRGRRLLPPEKQKEWAKALKCSPDEVFVNSTKC